MAELRSFGLGYDKKPRDILPFRMKLESDDSQSFVSLTNLLSQVVRLPHLGDELELRLEPIHVTL